MQIYRKSSIQPLIMGFFLLFALSGCAAAVGALGTVGSGVAGGAEYFVSTPVARTVSYDYDRVKKALLVALCKMVIDVEKRCPLLAAGTGGLSGPAIRPAAVYRVYQVAQSVSIPVVGMGGIWNVNDALEFMLAGATAIQVGTVLYADPAAGHRIIDGIRDYLTRHDLRSISDIVGIVSS